MIGECLRAKTSGLGRQDFGVVLAKGQEISNVGCSAQIVNLTRKYDDGRMDILTVGKRRFEILLTNEEKSYLRASVEFFDDDGSDTPGETEAENAVRLFREIMRRLHQASEMPVRPAPALPPPFLPSRCVASSGARIQATTPFAAK